MSPHYSSRTLFVGFLYTLVRPVKSYGDTFRHCFLTAFFILAAACTEKSNEHSTLQERIKEKKHEHETNSAHESHNRNVLTSLPPIGLIAEDLLGSHFTVDVLLTQQASAHHYALKPSDIQRVENADWFFWVGPTLEVYLQKVVTKNPQAVSLFDPPSITASENKMKDPHIWLSIDGAWQITEKISKTLRPSVESQLDENLQIMRNQFDTLKRELSTRLLPHTEKAFATHHDSLSRFVQEWGFTKVNTLAEIPEQHISVKRLNEFQKNNQGDVHCLIAEDSEATQAKRYGNMLKVKIVKVDILARRRHYTSFADFYRQIVDDFLTCFLDASKEKKTR